MSDTPYTNHNYHGSADQTVNAIRLRCTDGLRTTTSKKTPSVQFGAC